MENGVFPTKGNLIASKNSYNLSKLGFELLDKKRVILVNELMRYVGESKNRRGEVEELFKKAYAILQKANITMGSSAISSYAHATPLENTVEISERSIMGVGIPVVKYKKQTEMKPGYGVLNTEETLDEVFCAFSEIKEKLLELAETEVAVQKLSAAVKKTSKRANALKNIMIPKFSEQIKVISDVLDEKEREEFSRLKIIKKD